MSDNEPEGNLQKKVEELKKKLEEKEKELKETIEFYSESLQTTRNLWFEEVEKLKRRHERFKDNIAHERKEHYRIENFHLTVHEDRILGRGTFGTVREGSLEIQRDVAVKDIRLGELTSKDEAVKEFQKHAGLINPNVVRVYGYSYPEEHIFRIIMEKMDMNVLQYVQKHELKISEKLSLMKKMFEAVKFCHSRTPIVIHRDIKCPNFLINEQFQVVKITDFGIYAVLTSTQPYGLDTYEAGTLKFEAPEVMEDNEYSKKSDIYSLGITFWQVLFERTPYPEETDMQIYSGVKNGSLRPPFHVDDGQNVDLPQEIRELLEKMWEGYTDDRYSTEDVEKWFKEKEEDVILKFGDLNFPIKKEEKAKKGKKEEIEGEED